MRRTGVGVFALLAVAIYAPSVAAQVCAGFPTVDRQFSFGGSLGFPDGGNQYGAEVSYNVQGPFAVFGGVDIFSPDGEGDSTDVFYAGGSYNLLSLSVGEGANPVQVCPTARVDYSSGDGYSVLQVPVGVGLGTSLSLTPAAQLMPYVIPQLVVSRVSVDGFDSETETSLGVRGGALIGVGMFFIGAELEHLFEDNFDTAYGIRAGIRL